MTSTAAICLPIAKKAGVEVTIAHARSAGVDAGLKGYLTKYLRRNLYKKCDYRFTCSALAGEAVFGDQRKAKRKAHFIPNAIDVDKFAFEKETRKQIRYELGIEDKFVIGHVGRFSPVKNHKFMLQMLEQCIKIEREKNLPQTVMMFLGDGPLKEEIQNQAMEMSLTSRILFMGNKKDVYRYYQAMDYFLLPSFYEGLPGTAIEAQVAGLPGMLSDTITEEAVVTDLLQIESIKKEPALWAEKIMEKCQQFTEASDLGVKKVQVGIQTREKYADVVKQASFDIKTQAKRMQEFYVTGNWK